MWYTQRNYTLIIFSNFNIKTRPKFQQYYRNRQRDYLLWYKIFKRYNNIHRNFNRLQKYVYIYIYLHTWEEGIVKHSENMDYRGFGSHWCWKKYYKLLKKNSHDARQKEATACSRRTTLYRSKCVIGFKRVSSGKFSNIITYLYTCDLNIDVNHNIRWSFSAENVLST